MNFNTSFNSSIVLILLSIGLFYTFTSGQYQEGKVLRDLAGQYRDIIDNVSKIEDRRDELSVAYEALPAAEVERINKILPENNDSVRLALDLDNIAARHRIALNSINATTDNDTISQTIILPTASSYGKVTVSLEFVATYDNFMSFLADLEKNLRLMDVRSLTFRANDDNLYQYTLTFDTYWLR